MEKEELFETCFPEKIGQNMSNELNETIKKLNESGFVRYVSNDMVQLIKDSTKELIQLDDFLNHPKKYVKDVLLNLNLLLIEFVKHNSTENIEKIINTKNLNSIHYDSVISNIIEDKTYVPNIEVLTLLYEKISVNLREFLFAHCISVSKNKQIIDWVFQIINDEPYLEIENIFDKVEFINSCDFVLDNIIKYDLFLILKDNLFSLLFNNVNNARKFLEIYKRETDESDLSEISNDRVIMILLTYVIIKENIELGDLLLQNIKLNLNEVYLWFNYGLMHKKFNVLNWLFKRTGIEKIEKKTIECCLCMLKDDITCDILSYLNNNKDKFEELDFTLQDNVLMRNAIINEKEDIVKFLLENNVYLTYSCIEENELLNDTIEFFASEEIAELIKKHFGL